MTSLALLQLKYHLVTSHGLVTEVPLVTTHGLVITEVPFGN